MTTFVFLLFFTFCYLLRTAFLLSFPFFNYFLLYLFICSSFLLFVSISALHFCFYLLFLFPPCTFAFIFCFYFRRALLLLPFVSISALHFCFYLLFLFLLCTLFILVHFICTFHSPLCFLFMYFSMYEPYNDKAKKSQQPSESIQQNIIHIKYTKMTDQLKQLDTK